MVEKLPLPKPVQLGRLDHGSSGSWWNPCSLTNVVRHHERLKLRGPSVGRAVSIRESEEAQWRVGIEVVFACALPEAAAASVETVAVDGLA
jgi:hypothetical protein